MARVRGRSARIEITSPMAPPYWALLERRLLDAQAGACRAYFARYFDDHGYLLCVPRWGGNDGPDDAAENLLNWTLLHALGAHDDVLDLYKAGWEGHLRQYTEARTTEVPMGREGMYYKELHACFDWFHHGEALSSFVHQGLSDPDDPALLRRMRRFAGLYMGEDPQAPNWDPRHKLIRSFYNGSRGPLLRNATPVDTAGDPLDVPGRFRTLHGERTYQEMLERVREYTDVVGDNLLNICATSLAFTAYALTGEAKFRDWLLEYVDAWMARTEANGGLPPTSVALDGSLDGGYGWWGGVFGWGFTVENQPPNRGRMHRPNWQSRAHWGFANAYLLTGDRRYVDVWRRMYDVVNANCRRVNGQMHYPHMYGREDGRKDAGLGWYGYTPRPFAPGAAELFYWTRDRSVLSLLGHKPRWIAYLDGEDEAYPVDALQADLELLRRKMEQTREDPYPPDCTLSDNPNANNPVLTDTLVRLMLGGLAPERTGIGAPLHCRLWYFDPARRRAGLPHEVAALVERMTDDAVTAVLVNLDPVRPHTVLVQGGAYAEHQLTRVFADGTTTALDDTLLAVQLAPGAGAQIEATQTCYANAPRLAFPWV